MLRGPAPALGLPSLAIPPGSVAAVEVKYASEGGSEPGTPSAAVAPTHRREFCHFADALSPSLLKHVLKGDGGCSRMTASPTASGAGGELAVVLAVAVPRALRALRVAEEPAAGKPSTHGASAAVRLIAISRCRLVEHGASARSCSRRDSRGVLVHHRHQ